MAIVRWDPFRDFLSLQDELTRMFENRFGSTESGERSGGKPAVWAPSIDIYEKDENLVVSADLPGMNAEDVDISVEDNRLIVRGERTLSDEVKEDSFYRIERRYGSFERVIPLSEKVDQEKIAAEFSSGVLKVTLPRSEKAKPKKVSIDVRSGE